VALNGSFPQILPTVARIRFRAACAYLVFRKRRIRINAAFRSRSIAKTMHTTYWGRYPLNGKDIGVFPVIDFSIGILFPRLTVKLAMNEDHFQPQWRVDRLSPPAAATWESIGSEHSQKRTHPEDHVKIGVSLKQRRVLCFQMKRADTCR
jgi:hypothetical protein